GQPRASPARMPFTTRSQSPALARTIMRLTRAVTVGSAKVVGVADICWPTIGARPVSKAIRNASTCRRFVSGLLPKLKTLACRKSKTVSTLPSWRKPKPRAEAVDERRAERREGLVLGERVAPGVAAARAVAAPVHGAGRIGEPAEALCRHRALHRVKARVPARERDAEGVRIVHHGPERVAEIPGQAVEIAEDVAARAGRITMRRAPRIV